MNAQLTDDRQQTYSQDEYAKAFAVAKDALTYVATFQTPPTPDVYEIWYRFAEGSNSELTKQLSFAVEELKAVSRNRIEQLHQQFFARDQSIEDNADLTDNLAAELSELESMMGTQISISDDFDSAVSSVGENLHCDASPEEVRGCVQAVLSASESMQNQLRELKSQLQESRSSVDKLRAEVLDSQKIMLTDPLTGVGNRRSFDSLMRQSIDDSLNSQSSRILMLIDVDRFKQVNDVFGHAAGDEVLRYVASEIQQLAPEVAVTRYGGDEFAVFMSCDEPKQGLALANEVCEYFASNRLTMRKTGETLGSVTLSIGMALLRSDDNTESWFDRADKLLYGAKQSGRSCVMAERNLDER